MVFVYIFPSRAGKYFRHFPTRDGLWTNKAGILYLRKISEESSQNLEQFSFLIVMFDIIRYTSLCDHSWWANVLEPKMEVFLVLDKSEVTIALHGSLRKADGENLYKLVLIFNSTGWSYIGYVRHCSVEIES